MKYIKYNLLLLVSVILFSCYEDQSTYAEGYNAITITGLEEEYHVLIGDTLRLTPTVTSLEDTEITYRWEFGAYTWFVTDGVTYISTEFEEISNEKDLTYVHTDKVGTYMLRFIATNEDGSSVVSPFFYSESAYTEGFVIVGTSPEGHSTLSYQECLGGEDVGNPFVSRVFERSNGEKLQGVITDMFKSYNAIFLHSPEKQSVYRVNLNTFLFETEYSYASLGEDYRSAGIFGSEMTRSVTTSFYMPILNGGMAYTNISYMEVFWDSGYSKELPNKGMVWRPDMWNGPLSYLIHPDGEVTCPWEYTVEYYKEQNYDIINYFMHDWENSYLALIVKTADGDMKLYRQGQSGFVWGSPTIIDANLVNNLTVNTELITEETVFSNNDSYNVAFFSNKDNKVYRWAHNQNQIPGEPFITLPEGEEVQYINSFPINRYLSAPALDWSEVHIYTNNPSRSGLTGSFYRYSALDGTLIKAHEGISDCPVEGFYACRR